jgi:predicted phosphoadenosine phosphosulfate sulfurtransferase
MNPLAGNLQCGEDAVTKATKRFIGISVLDAARKRIASLFDHFATVSVSFSAGKDSGVLLHLFADEARKRGVRFRVLFIDWEAQYQATIAYAEQMKAMYADCTDWTWVALPLRTTNACSQIEPEWVCWGIEKKPLWVRPPPPHAVTDCAAIPGAYPGMTFEEFVVVYAASLPAPACVALGLRATESLMRQRAVLREDVTRWHGYCWTSVAASGAVTAYPLYDWRTEDVWTYYGREKKPYNPIYDLMAKAGLSIHQSRICEPYGDEQRRGLHLWHVLEPATWAKVCARVAGACMGARYASTRQGMLGEGALTLPDGHTWQSYTLFLLDTMPSATAEHYRAKIGVYVAYCQKNYDGKYASGLPDCATGDCAAEDVPSWRRIARCVLKHDYWCRSLSFSPTVNAAYRRYMERARNRKVETSC